MNLSTQMANRLRILVGIAPQVIALGAVVCSSQACNRRSQADDKKSDVGKDWLDCPVVQGSISDKDSMLCPVTNKDYRDWRQRHRQGGDFMIQTDRLSVRLESPIRVML